MLTIKIDYNNRTRTLKSRADFQKYWKLGAVLVDAKYDNKKVSLSYLLQATNEKSNVVVEEVKEVKKEKVDKEIKVEKPKAKTRAKSIK